MSTEENKVVARRFIERAFFGGDMDVANELLADTVLNENSHIYQQPGSVRDGVRAAIRLIHQGFPDISAAIKEMIAEDDRVMARFILKGTNTGLYRGLPEPTGKQASMRVFLIFRVIDGRVIEIRDVADRMEFLTHLGILPDIG